jgi:bacillithiol biosynthesis cysteine-adding enzyme BshC
MPIDCIPFEDTGYFSNLVCDYLKQEEKLASFYRSFPSDAAFLTHAKERNKQFPKTHRRILVEVLKEQYQNIETSSETQQAIQLLAEDTTVTITTGHQLNLFSGPLYFLYKIISTINLSEKLSENYKDINVVPVFWMATEDHDFEEINHFTLHGKKFKWSPERYSDNANGAVGRFTTEGLEDVLKLLKAELGVGHQAEYLVKLFEDTYLNHNTLAEATRYLTNELFAKYGLVILDADHPKLKQLFVPTVLDELQHQTSYKAVANTSKHLESANYPVQVSAREINLFYLTETSRERIINVDGTFGVVDSDKIWNSDQELFEEVSAHPERFSPNVIMRPLYQETILPNICYIGGGGELAYWFELKTYFDKVEVPFPILLLRNSVLLRTDKQYEKQQKLRVSNEELFLKQHELINRKVRQISNINIDFSTQKAHLKDQFEAMYALAEKTDATFLGAVKAQEIKQLKGLDHLEQRLLKAQRLKLKDEVSRLVALQNDFFPLKSLQERTINFSEFYLEYGDQLINELKENLDPLSHEFSILTL